MNKMLETHPVSERRPAPKALLVVSTLFLLGGLWSLALTVQSLLEGRWVTDLGLLGIPAFFGLRSFSCGWRTYALAMLWTIMVLAPIRIFFCNVTYLVVWTKLVKNVQDSDLPSVWTPAIAVLLFMLAFWQYRVLTRREVRELFFVSQISGLRPRIAMAQG